MGCEKNFWKFCSIFEVRKSLRDHLVQHLNFHDGETEAHGAQH